MPTPSDLLAKVRRVEIKTKRLVNDMMVGAYHSQFKGRGMDFEELREYIPTFRDVVADEEVSLFSDEITVNCALLV